MTNDSGPCTSLERHKRVQEPVHPWCTTTHPLNMDPDFKPSSMDDEPLSPKPLVVLVFGETRQQGAALMAALKQIMITLSLYHHIYRIRSNAVTRYMTEKDAAPYVAKLLHADRHGKRQYGDARCFLQLCYGDAALRTHNGIDKAFLACADHVTDALAIAHIRLESHNERAVRFQCQWLLYQDKGDVGGYWQILRDAECAGVDQYSVRVFEDLLCDITVKVAVQGKVRHEFVVCRFDSVGELVRRLRAIEDKSMSLMQGPSILQDDECLADRSIVNGCTLDLVLPNAEQ